MHMQDDFSLDPQIRIEQQLISHADRTGKRIFNRQQRISHPAVLNSVKQIAEILTWQHRDLIAKVLADRQFRVRTVNTPEMQP